MGISNAKRALATWGPKLGRHHASRVALVVMAIKTRDSDPHPTYFAGFEPIAEALGASGSPRARINVVNRALRPLADHGAIVVIGGSGNGRRTTYGLKLDPVVADADERPSGQRRSSVTSDHGGLPWSSVQDDQNLTPGDVVAHPSDASWSPVTGALVIGHAGPKKKEEVEGDGAAPVLRVVPSSVVAQAAPTPVPRALHVYTVPTDSYALLRFAGDGSAWLKAHGIPAMWLRVCRGFSLRAERLPDVMALAQRDHVATHIHRRAAS